MATPNENTGPDKGQIRQTVSDIKDVKREQGDFNDAIKESINLLKQLDRSYERIEARLESLNKSSINIRDINNALFKAKQQEFITTKRLEEAEKQISDDSKNRVNDYLKSQNLISSFQDKLLDAKRKGGLQEIKIAEANLERALVLNEAQKSALNVQEAELIGLKEADRIAKEGIKIGEEKLKIEKELKNQIGFSGAALGLFAKKLGLGNDAYEKMVEKARTLQETGKKITFFDKLSILGKTAGAGLKEAFTDPLTAIPLIGTAIGGLVKGFMQIVELGLEAQDRTTKFGRAVGLSKEEAQGVVNNFQKISLNSNSALVTIQRLVESQKELTDELGVNNILSGEILETNVKLKDLAGLDAQTRAEIAKSSVITGQSSEGITKSVLAQVTGLKSATGISFNYQKILKEASNLGGYLGLSFSKYPAQLSKSLVTVKSMGLELKQLDSMADSFLDFESSISKEFEAQLLTGKQINLTKAREAFLNNDLATAAKEITSQVGSSQDFLKLNRIQAESLASAFGMSRDQMGEMLKQQEMLSKLGAKDLKDAQAKVEALKAQGKSKEEIAKITGEEAYQSLVNASAQEKIAGFMDKIKEAIGNFIANSPLMPLIDRAIDYLSKPSNIKAIVASIQGAFAFIFDVVGNVAAAIMKVANFFGAGIDKDLIKTAQSGGDNIRAMKFDMPTTVSDNAAKERKGATTTSENPYGGNRLAKPQPIVIQNINKVKAVMDQKELNNADQTVALSIDGQAGR